MGRDTTGSPVDKNPNGVNGNSRSSNGVQAQVPAVGSPEKAERSFDARTDECSKKHDHEPEEKIIEAEIHNSIDGKLTSATALDGSSSLRPDHARDARKTAAKPADSRSLEPSKKLEQNSFSKSCYDEEDNWSLASSTATSVRTAKITVPVAPRFSCLDRLQRRNEFYSKLEEKHRALDKEKFEYEARIKEEEQAAIKLMRRNMSYKANPVPSFYRDGPPAKVELKKLPLTRAKSPVFTRRKSYGDAAAKTSPFPAPSPPEKIHQCGRTANNRHSTGTTRPPNGSSRTSSRQVKKAVEIEVEGKGNANIAVES